MKVRRTLFGQAMEDELADLRERGVYLLVGSTGASLPLPAAEARLGRRTALTVPLLPPPQNN
jgi:hypothetical protein